ncbi:DUF4357 domain-containing protein [Trueperella pyogenes]|uniref:DUF4357 domain-containing protein n=1 Tax=Trueperella pyogenes TaxID=1661 RepID=UPI001ADA0E41|nr:DUF4357 domain-containing protein [Trueperella pyogenes]
MVLAGSQLRPIENFNPSSPKSALQNREKFASKISGNTLMSDVLLGSPSGAASFVYGASANGLTEWKTDDGVTLAQLERGHT